MERILLVDDEKDILEFLHYNLTREGYEVYTANNGKDALKQAKLLKPSVIVLDVMMPEMDGIETCTELRKLNELKNTIIVFLTARGEDYSQIAGLEAGADDYITKPIRPRVFISKIKSLLRRFSPEPYVEEKKSVGNVTIDYEKYLVLCDGKEIELPRKEFELLDLLMSRPGKVFTREEIFTRVWGNMVVVGDRTIDVHIRKLREKIGEDYIKTIKGVGYKFES